MSIHGLAQAVRNYVLSAVTNFGVTASRANQSCGYAATMEDLLGEEEEREIDDDGIIIMELLVVIIG